MRAIVEEGLLIPARLACDCFCFCVGFVWVGETTVSLLRVMR
jgi:hypothetical protein